MKRNAELIKRIETLANSTSFSPAAIPANLDETIPEGAAFLVSNYAVLFVTPTIESTSESIEQVWRESENLISKILHLLEVKGMLVDGYLVIALEQPPKDAVVLCIREIEMNTSVCRKHVVWPIGDSSSKWDARLRYITVLGLPTNEGDVAATLEGTSLPPLAQEVLGLYDSGRSYKSIVEFIEKEADAN